ncbi:hypothetical protein E4U33_002570 [Claviceps sp. LM78 group G4]|nr:hypothetical protein E4U33_002570 [Claviceps sp. LM78 group G4]
MILPSLSVGFVSTLALVSLLSCIEASRGTLKDDVVDLGPDAQLSHVAREAPPDYNAPTYGYDNPPPYQYATSTLASDSITLTSTDSMTNTVIDTTTVTTNGESSYYSDTTTSVIVSQNTDDTASPSSSTWVESSVLGITGTSTSAISKTTTFLSVSTFSTASESTTSTMLTPSLPMSSGIASNSSSIMGTSTSSHDNNTWTTTMTGNPETSTNEFVTSSRLTFESSQLPITESVSSWFNYSSSSTTWSSATPEPGTATNSGVSSLKPSPTPSSLTWSPVFNTTMSASASVSPSVSVPVIANSTLSTSGIQTSTTSSNQTAIWPTSYGQTSTRGDSSQSLSSTTSSNALSQTISDGNPRTRTYFSSQWTNSTSISTQDGTFSGPTQILTSRTSVSSIPTSLPLSTWYTTPNTSTLAITTQETRTVPLSSGTSRNTTLQSSPSPPFSIPANSTASPSTSSGSSWIQSSVLGTGITLTSGMPTVSVPTQGPPWSSKIVSVPPFQNSTTTFPFSGTGPSTLTRTSIGNTTYHNPWTPSTVSLTTVTSIVWSSSQPQSSQHNSTDSSVLVTVDPQTSTPSSPYQSSSVAISTGFTSGVPISYTSSNSTYHWPTTMKSSTSHSSISTDYESSSETFKPTVTKTMLNSTSVQTLSKPSTSTMQQWTNSTLTLQPTLSSNVSSTSNVDTTFTLPTSVTLTNSSYVPSSTSWSETSAQQTTTSLVTSRWYNSTVDGVPHSTTNSNESTSTQVTATTYPTVNATSSGTTSLNATSGQTVMPSSVTETSSKRTLWPSVTLSTDKTHDQTPSSQPASTQTRSEATSTYSLSSSFTPTTIGSSAPVSTSTTSSRCARRRKTKSSSLETRSRTAVETEPVLTTLKTLASTEKGTSERQASGSHSSTTVTEPQATPNLPKNPNFPWGGDSPIHRHQSIGQLGAGLPKERLWKRWTRKVKDTMEFMRV